MASIANDANGRKRILWKDHNGDRRTLRIGKANKRQAQEVKRHIEELAQAKRFGLALSEQTREWLAAISPELHTRLADAGLAEPVTQRLLSAFLERFLSHKEKHVKPTSLKKLRQTTEKLLSFFDSTTPLHAITPEALQEWFDDLAVSVSLATARTHAGNAKSIFARAVEWDLLTRSPMPASIRGGTTASKNTRHVSEVELAAVIDNCPDAQWRALVALAGYAGLRVPSETHGLRWDNIDWEAGHMRVRSPKTERFDGKDSRLVPIDPKLYEILMEGFHMAAEGQDTVLTMKHGGQSNRKLRRIVEHAGVEPWADAFQTLRRSREKTWSDQFPQYVVSAWIGHSMTVSGKHYANHALAHHFEQASRRGAEAAQKAAQQNAARPRMGPHGEIGDISYAYTSDADANTCDAMRSTASARKSGAGGIRTPVSIRSANRVYTCSCRFTLARRNEGQRSFRQPWQTSFSRRSGLPALRSISRCCPSSPIGRQA